MKGNTSNKNISSSKVPSPTVVGFTDI